MEKLQMNLETGSIDNKNNLVQFFIKDMSVNQKLISLFINFFFAVLSILIALYIPNKYTSSVILVPANESSITTNSIGRQYGALASISGFNLKEDISNSVIAIELAQSLDFVTNFIESRKLLEKLFASKRWNLATNELIYNKKLYDPRSDTWVRKVKAPLKSRPSGFEIYEKWNEDIFRVSEDRKTGIIKFSLTSHSPYLSQEILQYLILDLNSTLQKSDIRKIQMKKEFILRELDSTLNDDLKHLLNQMLQDYTEKIALANSSIEYALRVIDPPYLPQKKSSPNRALICILITLLGSSLSFAYILLVKKNKK